MFVRHHRFFAALTCVVAGCLIPAACSSWQYATPPTAGGTSRATPLESTDKPIIVIGRFENPERAAVRWREIGEGMSDALAKQLARDGDYQVRVDHDLARRVTDSAVRPLAERESGFAKIRSDYPFLRYVVTGKVTDFTHSSELPDEMRRRGVFGKRSDAIVAIQLNVVDVEVATSIATDHVHATAAAPETPVRETYRDIAFGSYVFWSSPLGRASNEAVERAASKIRKAAPADAPDVRIVRQITERKVLLSATLNETLVPGREYYVCRVNPTNGRVQPVLDPDTAIPLRARINEHNRLESSAWLIGRKPLEVDLRGAILTLTLPKEPDKPKTIASGADASEKSGDSGPDAKAAASAAAKP